MSWVSESVRAVMEYLPLILVILIIGVIIKILMDIAERFGKGKLASIIPLPLIVILTTILTFLFSPTAIFAQNATNTTIIDLSEVLGPIIPLFIGMIMLLIIIILILKMLESIMRR